MTKQGDETTHATGEFVTKEVCTLHREADERLSSKMSKILEDAVETLQTIEKTIALQVQWQETHQKTHDAGWGKAHTLAVVVSTIIASAALVCTLVLAFTG